MSVTVLLRNTEVVGLWVHMPSGWWKKLKWVRRGLQEWRRSSGRNSKSRIDALKNELRHTYKTSSFAIDEV